jgi:hypothetical protein
LSLIAAEPALLCAWLDLPGTFTSYRQLKGRQLRGLSFWLEDI